jgi:hypothetical protein
MCIYIDVTQNVFKIICFQEIFCFQQKHFKKSHASIKKIFINSKKYFLIYKTCNFFYLFKTILILPYVKLLIDIKIEHLVL